MARQAEPDFDDFEEDGDLLDPDNRIEGSEIEPDMEALQDLSLFDDPGELVGEGLDRQPAEEGDPVDLPPVLSSQPVKANGSNGHKPRRNRRRSQALESPPSIQASYTARPSSPSPREHDLMNALAEKAVGSRSVQEVMYLAAAMVPLAAQSAGAHSVALVPVLPALLRGAASAARVMHSMPASRQCLKLMPAILDKTFRRLSQTIEREGAIGAEQAAEILAEYTGSMIEEYYRSRGRGK
jgi:hypothetical protein